MAFPNDSSRIVRGLANVEASTNDYTTTPNKAARSLIRKSYVLTKPAADGAASTATAYTAACFISMKNAGRILGMKVLPQGTLTADASNYATVNAISADGAAGTQVIMASLATDVAGGSWAAGVVKTGTITSTAANLRFVAGAIVGFAIAKTGTGVVVPICQIQIDVEEEGPDGYAV